MDIQANNELYNSLKKYNLGLTNNFGNTILDVPPVNPKFPFTLLQCIRDVSVSEAKHGKISDKAYRLDIFAQDKGKFNRRLIAENIANQVDEFMGYVGLKRVSYNFIDVEGEGALAHIILTYSANLDEYRRRFF